MALPAFSDWRVETLRATFFFDDHQDAREKNWWQGVTGGLSPDTIQNKPQQGEYLEVGDYLDGRLEMKVTFSRIDWTLSYPMAGLPDAPVSVELEQIAKSFMSTISVWVEGLTTAPLRVAYGSVTLYPVSSQKEGSTLVSEFLPFFKIDPGSVEDVFLQLNFPRSSSVLEELEVNDIVKLTVMTGQFMELSGGVVPKVATKHMLRAELDLSTAADREIALDFDLLMPLLEEMLESSLHTLKEGVRR